MNRLFLDPVNWRAMALAVIPTFAVAWFAGRAARLAVARAMRHVLRDTVATSHPLVRTPLRLIGLAAFAMVFTVLIFPAFEFVGLRPRAGVPLRSLSVWTFDSGLRIVLITAVAYAVMRLVGLVVQRFENDINFGTGLDALERAKRARTLGSVLTSMTTIVVIVIAVLMVLRELGVDIAPALTGAGIIGIALGFGAQTLVKDLIGGFFLILENQVRVGDLASINGVEGLVAAINLRTIILRDEEGTVHVIPNGSITTLANRSKEFSYAVVGVPVAYGTDIEAVFGWLREAGESLQRDDRYLPFVLAPIEILGVDAFDEKSVKIKLRMKTAPLKQAEIARELRRRAGRVLQERGVTMWTR